MIAVEGRIYGVDQIARLYAKAPGAFYKAIRHRMYSERKRYIGNKDGMGLFQKTLARIKRSGQGVFSRGGYIPHNVARSFKGYLSGGGSGGIGTMKMHMGIGLRHPNDFTEGLARLDASYTGSRTSASAKYMPVPVYRNLSNYIPDYTGKTFYKLMRENRLTAVIAGNKIFYYMKEGKYKRQREGQQFKKNALVFIGTNKITVKPKFVYIDFMKTQDALITARAQREIDATCRRLSRAEQGLKGGHFRESDFNITGGFKDE
jgi:hypothetical protein